MSEGIVIALIGFAGAVLGAAMAGFAVIAAAQIKDGKTQLSCGVIGLAASTGAAIGLVLGAVLGTILLQQPATQNPLFTPSNPTPVVIVVTTTASSSRDRGSVRITETPRNVQPPSPIHLRTGDDRILPDNWVWVCTGDFAATNSFGQRTEYYDHVAGTGLVLAVQPNSSISLSGPSDLSPGHDIGDCAAYSVEGKGAAMTQATSAQLSGGCGSKCLSVRVVELGASGTVIADYWKP